MRIIIIISIIVFFSCNRLDTKEENINNKTQKKIVYVDGSFEEFYSYYGIIVNNYDEHNFYCIEKNIMLKYLETNIDTIQLKNDLKKAIWVSDIRSRSYDYYAWVNFQNTQPENITLNYCDKNRRSSVIPVYLVEFNARMQTKLSVVDTCQGLHPLPFKIQSRPRINMIYVSPLNTKTCNEFLDLKDTLNRVSYQKFLEHYF